jgi:hypothetical protein
MLLMTLEIPTMMVLSTGHLTESTCNEWLHEAPFAVYEKDGYGWFISVPDDVDQNWPSSLLDCLELAREENCGWIMFDLDGPIIEDLPYYA